MTLFYDFAVITCLYKYINQNRYIYIVLVISF